MKILLPDVHHLSTIYLAFHKRINKKLHSPEKNIFKAEKKKKKL